MRNAFSTKILWHCLFYAVHVRYFDPQHLIQIFLAFRFCEYSKFKAFRYCEYNEGEAGRRSFPGYQL